MGVPRTSLSAGRVINKILTEDEGVQRMTHTVFPVHKDQAEAPYIFYKRASLEGTAVKQSVGPNSVLMEVNCCSNDYDESVDLAELALAALNGRTASVGDLRMRSCILVDSYEGWDEDAYVQKLIFNIKIS